MFLKIVSTCSCCPLWPAYSHSFSHSARNSWSHRRRPAASSVLCRTWGDRFSSAPESRSSRPGRQVATNDQGQFRITDLPAGDYTLTASYIGFAPSTTNVKLQSGQVATVNATLQVASGADTVMVSAARLQGEAEAINIERMSSEIVQILPERVITSLPNTNIADAVGRLPSVSLERDEGEGKVCADSRHRAAAEQRHHQWRECAGAGSDRAEYQTGCGAFRYRRADRGVQNAFRRTRMAMASAETSTW